MSSSTTPKSGGPGRFSRSLSFWLIAFLIPIVLIQFAGKGRERATEVEYSFYDQQLGKDNIARVTIVGGKEVVGEFRERVLLKDFTSRPFTRTPAS